MEIDRDRKLSNAFIEEHKRKELKIDIDEKLEPDSKCCIYRVPKELRKINEAAYTPQLISIGPFHHGKEDFVEMEKQKVRYKKEFGERMIEENWEDFITFIGKEEQHIRNCYSETSHLQSLDFITMILYDAIFIIELFLKFWESVQESETSSGVGSKFQECKNDFLLNKPWLTNGLQRDLQLLENQLPYFVLEELYKSTIFKVQPEDQDFLSLTVRFFCDSMCSRKHTYYSKLNHFTDLRRRDFTDLSRSDFTDLRRRDLLQNDPEECPFLSDLPSAVKLNESGVKFKVSTERYLADIERELRNFKIPIPYFSGVELKIPYFSGVELKIPHLLVVDNTECDGI